MNKEDFFIQALPFSPFNGDDGAVIGEWVYSQDAFFENIHFKREWMTPQQIGYKAMIVNISDAIAMNATPLYALLSVAMPSDFSTEEIVALQKGINEACAQFGIEIIGGDTIANTKLDLNVTIIAKTEAPLYRKGIRYKDIVAYTGTLGESGRDLERLFQGETISENSRFYRPILRQEFIRLVRPFLHAGMDISDGLGHELSRLSRINNLGFTFLTTLTPDILCSGEEYEMLITFSSENLAKIEEIARQTQTPLTIFAHTDEGCYESPCKAHHFC